MKHLFAFALPDSGLKPMALTDIRRSKTDNDVLYADRADIEVDGPAQKTSLSPDQAMAALNAKALELGAELKLEQDGMLFFTWRSPTIGFPNAAYAYVTADRVSLYGKALYGRRDFGANRAFIDQLAQAL